MLGVIIKVVVVMVLVIIATAAALTMSDIDKKRLIIQKGVPQLLFAALDHEQEYPEEQQKLSKS